MNFQSTSVPVSDKIKSVDQGIISTCQERILSTIHQEIFTALRQNKLSIEVVHQLSSECLLFQVDIRDELSEEQRIGASLFLVNFSSECRQLYIINLMNLRSEADLTSKSVLIQDSNSTRKYSLESSRVYFESNSFSTALITKIRAVCLNRYVNEEGQVYCVLTYDPHHDMTLIGTREANTGKLFYFPPKQSA
ncbi:MAG: hypothetical protein ACOYOK_15625 [Pseudobdellovibrionaceae bacterium]